MKDFEFSNVEHVFIDVWSLSLSSPGEVQRDGWSEKRYIEGRKAMLLGHGATEGLGSTVDPGGKERQPGAESKLCGQTPPDALGTISATWLAT